LWETHVCPWVKYSVCIFDTKARGWRGRRREESKGVVSPAVREDPQIEEGFVGHARGTNEPPTYHANIGVVIAIVQQKYGFWEWV